MKKRKILIVTGTRADYGLLGWLMKEIESDPDLTLQIIATGMHLSQEFGFTYKTIEKDGFQIDARVEMPLSEDTPVAVTKSMGIGVIGFADALDLLKPDVMVVLGDRFEILAAAQAAMIARTPIAHIHGGESTEGAIDEAIRHAITKMSHLHFVAADSYREKVIQMGEHPDRVFHVGAPGLDAIDRMQLLSRKEFEKGIDFNIGKSCFLVTYHPETLLEIKPGKVMGALLAVLDRFPASKIIFTKPNCDPGNRQIAQLIDDYVLNNPERCLSAISLGQLLYLSALKHADLIIGNSSSGLIEAPAFKIPTINIGERQRGRLRASSVVDCDETFKGIHEAVQQALSPEFQKNFSNMISPYYKKDASLKIKEILKNSKLTGILKKKFYYPPK